jgi:hypothetical protein
MVPFKENTIQGEDNRDFVEMVKDHETAPTLIMAIFYR